MANDTQCAAVLKHLKRRTITQAQAAELYGVWRLADVALKLRKRGHDIRTQMIEDTNRYGHRVCYGRYRLVKGSAPVAAWAA